MPAAPEQSDEELDFVKYSCNTRKMAVKNDGIITISSITEASVKITGFTDEKNMCGKYLIYQRIYMYLVHIY